MLARKLLMVELSPYQAVERRPYSFDGSGFAIEDFARTTNDGRMVSPQAVAKLGADMLRPSTFSEGVVQIENGWNSKRYTFILEIEHDSIMSSGGKIIQYLAGYTNSSFDLPAFFTGNIALPPELTFRFTSNITVLETTTRDAMGNLRTTAMPQEASTLLYGDYMPYENRVDHSMRGQDLLAYASTSRWVGATATGGSDDAVNDILKQFNPSQVEAIPGTTTMRGMDSAVTFCTEKVKQANIHSSVPSQYMADIMKSMSLSHDTLAIGSSTTDADEIMAFAVDGVRSPSTHNDRTLKEIQQNLGLTWDGSIDWHMLKELMPNIDSVTSVMPFQNAVQTGEMRWNPMDSHHWRDTNNETIFASALASSLPATMMERFVQKVRFTADNYGRPAMFVPRGQWSINWDGCTSFIHGYDNILAAQQMEAVLTSLVLPGMVGSSQQDVKIVVGADTLMDTQFRISINGDHEVPFTVPNFAPFTMSPIISNDNRRVSQLANDIVNTAMFVTNPSNF